MDDYYSEKGVFLCTDHRCSDNIRIINQFTWNYLLMRYPNEGKTESSLSFYKDLQYFSTGIEDNLLSAKAYSNIFTDILSKMDDVDISKIYNEKVSVYITLNDWNVEEVYNKPTLQFANALTGEMNGKIKLTAAIRALGNKEDNRFMYSTISNVKNLLGAHEYIGHGIKNGKIQIIHILRPMISK